MLKPKAQDIVTFKGARARVKQVSRDGRYTLRLIESAPGFPAHSKVQVRIDQLEGAGNQLGGTRD